MKAYTDIEQSRKLAEILPAESADMCYGIDDDTLKYNNLPWLIPYHKYTAKEYYIPCWSLAALLDILPSGTELLKFEYNYQCQSVMYDTWALNPINACYETILKLHKQKLL